MLDFRGGWVYLVGIRDGLQEIPKVFNLGLGACGGEVPSVQENISGGKKARVA